MGGRSMMPHGGGREFKPDRDIGAVLGFRRGCAVFSVFGLALTATLTVAAAGNGKQPVYGSIAFNIASQPLGSALETFARISSREVLYDGALAAGRRSSLVNGLYTPEVALQILLAGTGLWADFKDADFFVVGLASTDNTADASAAGQSVEHVRYYGRLQAGLRTAFCGHGVLPDGNRVAAQLWVGQQGEVLQVKKLGSAGNGELDQRIETVLSGLRLGGPPPVGFAQPITIVIMPSAPDAKKDCEKSGQSPEARP
jgi:hypothetical protein